MPRRKLIYPVKPHRMDEKVEARFRELMGKKEKKAPEIAPKNGWQLWRLDTLEDVSQDVNYRI